MVIWIPEREVKGFFYEGGNRRSVIPYCYQCAFILHGFSHQLNVTCSSAIIDISESICPLRARALQGRSHLSMSVLLCSHLPSDLYLVAPCWCKVRPLHRADHVISINVLACRRSGPINPQEGRRKLETGEETDDSNLPGIPAVGCLFIFCDVALIGAKVQTQWQIRCFIPHSKPSLRDAWWSDFQPRGQSEVWAVGMSLVHCSVLYKCSGAMSSTTVNEEVLTLLTIWRWEQEGLGKA